MKNYKNFIALIFLLLGSSCILQAQRFEFGLNTEVGMSQIEGDQLRGFNKPSYYIGIQGLYKINNKSRIVVEPGFGNLGSNRDTETIPSLFDDYLAELNIKVAYVGFYFNRDVIETWEGNNRLRLFGGVKMHNIIEEESKLISNKTIVNNPDEIVLRGKWFPSLVVGVGLLSNKHINLNFSYQHSLFNLLKERINNINNLTPFRIYFGFNYILK